MDLDKLLEEMIKRKREKSYWYVHFWWWVTNKCWRCGESMVKFYDLKICELKVCAWCNPKVPTSLKKKPYLIVKERINKNFIFLAVILVILWIVF